MNIPFFALTEMVISSLSLTLSNNQSEQLSSISTSEETNCTIVPGKLTNTPVVYTTAIADEWLVLVNRNPPKIWNRPARPRSQHEEINWFTQAR
ncbi:unnamed protein product [Heterobilharzia americana]|nr:unnamed protein product [Heterobilharzia americana]